MLISSHFGYFIVIFSHLGLWGVLWRLLWAPFYGLLCSTEPHVWSWVPRFAILDDPWAKEMLIYNHCSMFNILLPRKVVF